MNEPVPAPPSANPSANTGGKKKSALGAIGAGALFLFAKAKSVLGLLKLASLGKFALTGLSMLAMIAFEAQRGGWWFGIGFVLLILIHELGHGYAIKRAGLDAGWPVFIPFFGAMISLKGRPQSRGVEAAIAYGGPLAGAAASLACAAIGLATGARIWLALGYVGFYLNLFNMLPIAPLDGGRIAQSFSKRAWIIGGVLVGAMFFFSHAPQLLIIGLLALSHAFRRQGSDAAYAEAISEEEKRTWMYRYFGLCFFLGLALVFTGKLLSAGAAW